MPERTASNIPAQDAVAAPPRRRRRAVAAVAAVALVAGGVLAAGSLPAAAQPGNMGPSTAFTTSLAGVATDTAVDPYTGGVFVGRNGVVDVVDEYSGGLAATVPVPGAASPLLAADPSKAFVWVLDAAGKKLYRIDERTVTITGTVTLSGNVQHLTVDRTTGKVLVTTGTTGTILSVDESTLSQGTAITVGGAPSLIGVDTSTGTIFTVDPNGTVSIVDEAAGTVTVTVAAPAGTTAMTVDAAHHKAYLGLGSQVTVVDAVAQTVSQTINLQFGLGTGISTMSIDPTTQSVLLEAGQTVFAIDTVVGSQHLEFTTGSTPLLGMSVDPFSNTIFMGAGSTLWGMYEPVSILGSASGVAAAGQPYSQQLAAYGPSPTFAITGGALPAGLGLNGDTISGTPTTTGSSTFSVTVTDSYNDSVTQTYTIRVVTVDRTSGADRFATSVEVSKASYPDPSTVGTVYVANGLSFPDALSGGPAAAQDSGPLLLTGQDVLPASVSAEITRLHPTNIVVVGGPAVVGDSVFGALQSLAPHVQRVYGADRFATSRAVIQHSFTTAPTVYVSTGWNFPDSLSAGGAAGSQHAPLLLVNSAATSVDQATASLLLSLGTNKIVIIGGSSVMSPSLVADFARFGTVTHLAGANRFDSSQQVVEGAFTNSSHVILANGMNFPDALSASAWAGKSSSPLFITTATCVPQRTLDDIFFLGANDVTLIGGTTALNPSVAGLTSCDEVYSVIAPLLPAAGLAPAAAKTGASGGSAPVADHPVGPTLPVAPLTHHATLKH
ncbi:cell wall-binding repeat-containing protein [Leifsonia sp. P73]|uniref:cell wall-binding repeat-containing protein n=1 Tax=Leifsonia sp. P73 TaxID=3423959 RepID=UPI003DA5FA22